MLLRFEVWLRRLEAVGRRETARPGERRAAGGWWCWNPDPPQGEREDVLREQGQGRTHWFEIQIDDYSSKREV